jgi:hypothetical protein
MTAPMRSVALGLLAVVLVTAAAPAKTTTCPFCDIEGSQTMVGEFKQASMVLFGSFANPKLGPGNDIDSGTTDFVIEKTLKDHDFLKGKKVVNGQTVINLPKYILPTKSKFVVYCDVYKDQVSPYRGEEVPPGSDLLKYLAAGIELRDAPPGKRLRHCFDYLNNPDISVSTDAYREFAKADYADYKAMAKSLPAQTIADWLQDQKTPPHRYGLYGSLLGHCGDPAKHGALLRSMLDDPELRKGSGIYGLMAGYVMLQPKEAWDYLVSILTKDDLFLDKNGGYDDNLGFPVRHAAYKTMCFYWDNRPDVLSKEKLVSGMSHVIELPGVADFGIDTLRAWKAWAKTDAVLALEKREGYNNTTIKRAILRFALSSPSPKAKDYVAQQRKINPSLVEDTEEILRIEEPAVSPKKENPKK